MSSRQSGNKSTLDARNELKKRLINQWRSAVDPETGSFDFVFGDPSATAYAVRVLVYYNDDGDAGLKITLPGIETNKWSPEDSYTESEMRQLEALIEEAIPLMDRQLYEFAHAVYQALSSFDADPSLFDSELDVFIASGQSESLVKESQVLQQRTISERPRPSSSNASSSSSAAITPLIEYKIDSGYTFLLESYLQQTKRWPGRGQHILGTFTDSAILVYQAFNASIADYAVKEQKFTDAPGYSTSRMTWIKPNFLWMMYRSNWARSKNQDRILGVWLKLDAFHEMLAHATHTSTSGESEEWDSSPIDSVTGWKGRVKIQWDPDHGPSGESLSRRAVQIGVKNVPWWHTGERFEGIIDLTPLVIDQRKHVPSNLAQLFTPQEKIYVIPDKRIAKHVKTETSVAHLDEEKSLLVKHRKKANS